MLGLNIFSILVFGAINIYASMLSKYSEEARNRTLRLLLIVLLSFNLCSYAASSLLQSRVRLPVEFSAVAYFVVPSTVLLGIRARRWAAYSGIMAGFFYYAAMMVSGGKIYNEYPPYTIYISLCCHGILYLYGLVELKTQEFESRDSFFLLVGVGLIALNAWLLRPVLDTDTRLFIYELIDGAWVKHFPVLQAWEYGMTAYYVLLGGFVLLSIRLFYRLNRELHEKHTVLACRNEAVHSSVRALAG